MKETSRRLLTQGRSIGFVPTMGALHEGHLVLVKRARMDNDIVVVSIFVNPTQFGPNEDFEKYPRDTDSDIEKLIKAGADILFVPDAHSVYPEGFKTSVEVRGISDRLCGAFRPDHFSGVATIVNKLFNMVTPNRAYFGQKDFQQTRVIETMIADLNMNVEFIRCATVRESDGLARSSRNRYLSAPARVAAAIIYKTLSSAAELIRSGSQPSVVKEYMHEAIGAEPMIDMIQYAGVYDPVTLDEKEAAEKSSLLAAAVLIEHTRLIDNIIVEV
jgi:pantoate--beta-alanine ligase